MKAKVNQSSSLSFIDSVADVNLAALTKRTLMSFTAVVVVLLARFIQSCRNAARWCRYHFTTLPRIYRLQLRVSYAAAEWMERHEKATNLALVFLGVVFILEIFFFAPID